MNGLYFIRTVNLFHDFMHCFFRLVGSSLCSLGWPKMSTYWLLGILITAVGSEPVWLLVGKSWGMMGSSWSGVWKMSLENWESSLLNGWDGIWGTPELIQEWVVIQRNAYRLFSGLLLVDASLTPNVSSCYRDLFPLTDARECQSKSRWKYSVFHF